MISLSELLLEYLPKLEDNVTDGLKYFKALLLILKRFSFHSFIFYF